MCQISVEEERRGKRARRASADAPSKKHWSMMHHCRDQMIKRNDHSQVSSLPAPAAASF